MKTTTFLRAAATTALFLLASQASLFAQESYVAILLNTVNSRLNYGDMNTSLVDFKKDLRGIQAGLSWQAGLTRKFSIVTEVYFIRKGGSLMSGNPLDGLESTLKLNTVEVPVLARVHTGRFYFNAGPYVNYILSGKRSSPNEASTSIEFGSNAFRNWEAGVQGGLGYQLLLNKKRRMNIDLRYIHGMTSLHESANLYSRTINLSISLVKPLKRGRE